MMRLGAFLVILLGVPAVHGDGFDRIFNKEIADAVEKGQLKPQDSLTARQMGMAGGVLPGIPGTVLLMETNDGRRAKLLVQPGRQKYGKEIEPIVLVEKYTAFKEGTDRAVLASGQNLQLYAGQRFSLDLGQIVPEKFGGDLQIAYAEGRPGEIVLKPVGKAKMYLLDKLPAILTTQTAAPAVVGEQFEPKFFNGSFKLHVDGRRSGSLQLQLQDNGEVSGSFYSDKDGRKYDVFGKVGPVRHAIAFSIRYPQSEETFQGWMFTGDARAIAGSAKLQDREAGFYATRSEP